MFGFMNKSQDCYLKFNSYGIHPFETKSDMKEDKISMRVISFNIWMQWHWCVLWHIAICRNVAVWSHQIDLIFFHFGACRIELWELKVSFNHSRERDRKKMVDFLTESKYQSNGATKKKYSSSDIISNGMALLNDLSHHWIENQHRRSDVTYRKKRRRRRGR